MLGSGVLVFEGAMSLHSYYIAAFIGTVVWFSTVPFWMKRRLHNK